MSSISILKVAGNYVPISIMKKHLSCHFPSPEQKLGKHANQDDNDDDDDAFTTPVPLFIENKYFQAHLILEHCDYDHFKDDPIIRNMDGILLIFNHFDTSIDTLTDIHNRMCNNRSSKDDVEETIGDSLRLCISTSPSAIEESKANEEIYSQRVLWCLDRGYEYIEVDLSEEGMKIRPDVREKDGFDRVVEAIGSTVWRSAIMKHENVPSALLDHGQEHSSMNPLEKEQKQQYENKFVPSKEKKSEEVLMNEFEVLMNEAKKIREASKSGVLSDQERRDRAGNAAQMLMGLLDQMGFDDDDEEEDKDSSSSDEEE